MAELTLFLKSKYTRHQSVENKQLDPDALMQVVTSRKTGGKIKTLSAQQMGFQISHQSLNSPAAVMLVLDLEGGVPFNRDVYKQAS